MNRKTNQRNKIEALILHVPGKDVRIKMKGPEAVLMINGAESASFKRTSSILYHLLVHRNTYVSGAALRRLVPEGSKSNEVSNRVSLIRKIFEDCGLDAPIQTSGKGDTYKICFSASDNDIVYGDEYETTDTDSFLSGTAVFPPASKFTGGVEIRSDYLPQCQTSFNKYVNLDSCIHLELLKNPSCSSLVLTSVGGGGKTFSLCHAYRQAAERNIPAFYIRADSLEEEEHNLLHYIARRYLQAQNFQEHVDVLDQFIKEASRPVLILVDGLNECSSKKRDFCCTSFLQLQKQYPAWIKGVFASRFAQTLKSRLPEAMEVQLLPLPLQQFSSQSQALLSRLHVEPTPLIRKLLESMDPKQMAAIQHRYKLYTLYFDALIQQANRSSFDGWIYNVLAYTAAESAEGRTINNRWLKELCSDKGEYDFIHQWCASEEYPLEDPSTAEKLKGTGFLMKVDFDRYVIHQQFRDCLTIRYGMLQLECGVLSPADFLDRLIDVTRYYPLDDEDFDTINLRRHNNMDLAEFGFYALLDWYESHPQKQPPVSKLIQLGIHVAYLFDNVQNWHALYALHCRLDDLLSKYFEQKPADTHMIQTLLGYYYCLNKLVSTSHGMKALSSSVQLLDFSKTLQGYYEALLAALPGENELNARICSGLGGVYLARWRIADTFQDKISYLNHAGTYHTKAMEYRRTVSSERLFLSYAALGTVSYYKAKTLLDDPAGSRQKEAASLFSSAADYHQKAVSLEANFEKHVSWTRMAGCYYQLYQLACSRKDGPSALHFQKQLLTAILSSADALCASAAKVGAARHGSKIGELLHDISRYMTILPLRDEELRVIDTLCSLYHQAFPYLPLPYRNAENTRIIFS